MAKGTEIWAATLIRSDGRKFDGDIGSTVTAAINKAMHRLRFRSDVYHTPPTKVTADYWVTTLYVLPKRGKKRIIGSIAIERI